MAGSSASDSLQPWTIATVCSMTVLALTAVSLRVLSRYEQRQKLWWDDWMIIWSMFWNLLVVGFIFAMLACGMGIHATEVEPTKIVLMAQFLVVAEILYVFNLVWTKLSFLMMYYRIFHFPYFKTWAYIIGTFVILWVITITFVFIFICVPVQKLWYPELPGRCINQVGTWIANAASTILTDLAILILPIPQVWKLQLRKHQKIAITATFGLGFFVIFASAYRFRVLFSYTAEDPTYTLAHTVGWTAIEMSAGITSACLPTLLPAMRFFARKLGIEKSPFSSFVRSTKGASSHPTNTIITIGGGEHKGTGGATPNSDSGKWRPDHGHSFTTSTKGGASARGLKSSSEQDSLSGDEVPLHSIRVQTDFQRDEDKQ